jgi:hypothetical protein
MLPAAGAMEGIMERVSMETVERRALSVWRMRCLSSTDEHVRRAWRETFGALTVAQARDTLARLVLASERTRAMLPQADGYRTALSWLPPARSS